MRVIIINDFARVNGGAAAVAIASALGLSRRGHHVSFVAAVGPVDPRLLEANVNVICTGQYEIADDPNRLRAAAQGLWNLGASREVRRLLATGDIADTIIHVHGWTKALSSSVVHAVFNRQFKTICTLHDYFIACPNGGFFDYQSLSHCQLRPLSCSCIARNCDSRSYSHKLWRVARQFVQASTGRVPCGFDGLILLSQLSHRILRPYIPPNVLRFEIPNPIDMAREAPVEVARKESFVMIGRLTREKGGTQFALAARKSGVPAVFVGDGPCRHEIESANPEARITGWIPGERVPHYLAEARALVFPSLWYEVQPLAILEAAARGVPAIVSKACAGAELVTEGVSGLHFETGNVQSLATALAKFRDEKLVRDLGINAYDRYWISPPTLDHHVSLLEEAYHQILAKPVPVIRRTLESQNRGFPV